MPEPTSTAIGFAAAVTSSLGVLATVMGVPVPVVLAGILGATISVSLSEKMDLNWRNLFSSTASFAGSLGLGFWGGQVVGPVVVAFTNKWLEKEVLPDGVATPVVTFLVAAIGQREILRIALKVLRSKTEGAAS